VIAAMQKYNSLNHNLSIVLLSCVMSFSLSVNAEMYKWIDAEGNTHYTQSPPPDGIESATIKQPGKVDVESAQKSLKKQQNKADKLQEKREKEAEEKAKQEADAALDNKNCEISRSNAASLERPRVNLEDEEGNTYSAPEEERLKRLQKAREDVEKYCN
jgi:Skp family chaperone for outer membrane proteins